MMPQQVQQKIPSHQIKGLLDVKLEEQGRSVVALEPSRQVTHVHKIIMDTSFLNEGALCVGDKRGHVGGKPSGHHLSDDLSNRVNETDWPEVGDVLRPIFFRDEGNVSRVEPV